MEIELNDARKRILELEEQVKNLNILAINGSILAKAEMINALTNTMKVNKETLGEYHTLRDKTLIKLLNAIDDVQFISKTNNKNEIL